MATLPLKCVHCQSDDLIWDSPASQGKHHYRCCLCGRPCCENMTLRDQYQTQVSNTAEDPDWDAFLMQTPGGHYTQSCFWVQAKALLGWRAVRVVISQGDRIVAGAQFLIRHLPIGGTISYVPGGPLVTRDDPWLVHLLLTCMQRVAKDHHIQYLLVQPRSYNVTLDHALLSGGYQPCSRHMLATSTALLDLTQDLDLIVASMRKSTRRNMRLSQRKGVTVREGCEQDLPTFYRLLMITYTQNKLSTFSLEYYIGLWRILHPSGYLRLFLADYRGKSIAASLVIPFGDTVFDTLGGWSGDHAKAHPNELLEWTAITWAKSQGFHYFDFDGISPAVTRGEVVPTAEREGATFFKLGFGGKAVLCPDAYDYLPNPLLRWIYRALDQKIATGSGMMKLVNYVRGIGFR